MIFVEARREQLECAAPAISVEVQILVLEVTAIPGCLIVF